MQTAPDSSGSLGGEKMTLDGLKDWLTAQGFRTALNHMKSRENDCDWYAYRRSAIAAVPCECNEDKPAQIVVRPYSYSTDGRSYNSVEIDLTGEAGGIWFKLMAYSLRFDELPTRLADVEMSLVSAWNVLGRAALSLPPANSKGGA